MRVCMYVCVCVSACFTFISPTIMYFDLSLETKKTNKNKIDRTDRQTCSSSSNSSSSSRENGKKNKRKKIRKGPNREITAVTARHPRIKHAHTHTYTHIWLFKEKKHQVSQFLFPLLLSSEAQHQKKKGIKVGYTFIGTFFFFFSLSRLV